MRSPVSKSLDPTYVRAQIEMLRLRNPEVWEDGDDVLLVDMLEGETTLHEFLSVAIDRMQEAQIFADGLANIIADLKIRRDNRLARIDVLRDLMFKLMSIADVKKLELLRATLSIRAGTSKVLITDEGSLPDDCMRIRREPNKLIIKDQLERGVTVPGATLSNAEPVLNVRVK